jgi:hypothetical protein
MKPKQQLFSLIGHYERILNQDMNISEETYNDLTELMIIMGKSLLNDQAEEKISIDVPRLKEELILWKYYREGSIRCFLLNNGEKEQSSLISTGIISLLPLIIGNYDLETLEQELYAFASETKQKSDRLVLFLLMGKAIHTVMFKQYSNIDSFVQSLKEYIIFLNYDRFVQKEPEGNHNDKIAFEKEKIRWIMDLDRISKEELPGKDHIDDNSQLIFIQSIHLFLKYYEEPRFMELLKHFEVSSETKILSLALRDLKKRKDPSSPQNNFEGDHQPIDQDSFLKDMDQYFNKLKQFEILKTPYKVKKPAPPGYTDTKNLFLLKPGEKGRHLILRDFEIIEKTVLKDRLQLVVKTKSRYYKLKKPLAKG